MRKHSFAILYLHNGQPETNSILKAVWQKIVNEKLQARLFYDGSVSTEEEFCRELFRYGCLPFVVMLGGEFAAFSWLNCITGKMARTHFVIFRDYWGKHFHQGIGKNFYSYILTRKDGHGFLFDSLYGITPKSNSLAWKAAIDCGWHKVGELPNACFIARRNKSEPGIITCATREVLGIKDNEEREARWEL